MNPAVFIALLSVFIALAAMSSAYFAIFAAKRKRDQQLKDKDTSNITL